jgi:hypothetical protein
MPLFMLFDKIHIAYLVKNGTKKRENFIKREILKTQ